MDRFLRELLYDDFIDDIFVGAQDQLEAIHENPKILADAGEVIVQDENTILKVGDLRFLAKKEDCDKFDLEKGVMVCMLKALGVTTSDVIALCEKAVSKKSKKCDKTIKNNKKK